MWAETLPLIWAEMLAKFWELSHRSRNFRKNLQCTFCDVLGQTFKTIRGQSNLAPKADMEQSLLCKIEPLSISIFVLALARILRNSSCQ